MDNRIFEQYPMPVLDNASFGRFITKTMHLLHTSTPAHPNRVRIAFTGQSISNENNSWPRDLTAWLREMYPPAEIVYRNFAIGGFSTNFLYKRVPNDMASFYPHLVVFYDYGGDADYERMIRFIRENTTAEIMMQTDHFTGSHHTRGYDWSEKMAYHRLPEIAEQYGAQLCDIRTPWKNYILDNKVPYQDLLADDVHLNENGQTFMLALMKQFFVYREGGAAALQKRLIPVSAADWQNGVLTVPFTGNRVEVVPGIGPQHPVHVTIDGQKPSCILSAYVRTAANDGIETRLGITRYKALPGRQTFTVTLTGFEDEKHFTYTAEGSETGFEGASDANGVLDGKILSLDAESFTFHPASKKPKPGDCFTFQAVLNGRDIYDGSQSDANDGVPDKNTLISGLENGAHTLVLQADGAIPDILALEVHNPWA